MYTNDIREQEYSRFRERSQHEVGSILQTMGHRLRKQISNVNWDFHSALRPKDGVD